MPGYAPYMLCLVRVVAGRLDLTTVRALAGFDEDATTALLDAALAAGILVVDDEPAIRALVAKIVDRAGYPVDTARDGSEAIEKLALKRSRS